MSNYPMSNTTVPQAIEPNGGAPGAAYVEHECLGRLSQDGLL